MATGTRVDHPSPLLRRATGETFAPDTAGRSRWLPGVAALLTLLVIGLGAFVRLSDAGLGCPDWPGCYGHWLGVPTSEAEKAAAASAFPGALVDPSRAWKEMIHRYAAGTLGVLILFIFIAALRRATRQGVSGGQFPGMEGLLLFIVTLQALLGMWTVTDLLKPVIVTTHLLGGMLTLALLLALLLRANERTKPLIRDIARVVPQRAKLARRAGSIAILAITLQIALGGWVSSNYAALACQGFPSCNGDFWPTVDWAAAFEWQRHLGQSASGDALSIAALVTIHWAHRLGAIAVTVTLVFFAWALARCHARRGAIILLSLLALQISLGIANVLLLLPLPLAVAHNLGAALLLATGLVIRLRLPS